MCSAARLCMQREDSFSSVKGRKIESHSAMMCCHVIVYVCCAATQYNIDGSPTILRFKWLFVRMFNLRWALTLVFADGTENKLFEIFSSTENTTWHL